MKKNVTKKIFYSAAATAVLQVARLLALVLSLTLMMI